MLAAKCFSVFARLSLTVLFGTGQVAYGGYLRLFAGKQLPTNVLKNNTDLSCEHEARTGKFSKTTIMSRKMLHFFMEFR